MRERTRLYLISPPAFDVEAHARDLEAALGAGDVAAYQLRVKDRPDAEVLAVARRLLPLVQEAGVAFVMNDRPDLALSCGADGVHIGQEDAPYAQARAILGADKTIGVTCHDSLHLAYEAAEAGADYVAFGAFYTTETKSPKTQADPELLSVWQETMEIPCVAIGGITSENAAPLIAAGADFLAVSAGVWAYPDGAGEAVRRFNALFDAAS
ncbi:MAG: thiamine phosphate synthase [Alphaproteobacteria bacterium]|nr:thiamine phosphate synthase [Alphaproteobacteria bacterium]